MKSYKGTNSFHMVGQAWQIRIMLKQWQKEWGKDATVLDVIMPPKPRK
ncbi:MULTISPECIES: Z-ring formation inhibitor MciZ [Paenibacillus]|uniref:Z-ring formation inhibitor MciZ n=1 Tax=Paenibacillus campinasensis TaxID=66347 RepID=A0A268F2R2_9BACL|nr:MULTISPECIES: Z-ring formation inhibitor MciZ [Paenibacillus]MUG64933.1 Z-ring formation inhibitor MciZ [Paenibacillus campinasensis]PAD79652.1 Z-ring formation inhibitor MciZ [Paenibacillus campinasensis]PAK53515.1 Z-ring formation inhibitor MciZ [Paenibacillus sp. 7541]